MSNVLKLNFKRMGVMNITPNSFSDGRELSTLEALMSRLHQYGPIDCLDVGAESTAPMNEAISATEEWSRFAPFLPFLQNYSGTLSIDTYHPETIFEFVKLKRDGLLKGELMWNDVSGKFDASVREFLRTDPSLSYVFCHNLAPTREESSKHMSVLSETQGLNYLDELTTYFAPYKHPQVIFDPCLGFSKTYEQNWLILDHFKSLQIMVNHPRWLLGFSRKSFLRKKYGIEKLTGETREELDQLHRLELQRLKALTTGELWIRTHRPELID